MSASARAPLVALLPMFLSVAALVYLGISSIRAWPGDEGDKQLIFLLFAVASLLFVQSISYRTLIRLSPLLFAVSLLPVLYTVVGRYTSVPFVRPVNGAYAWIIFGTVSFQPAELVKICLVLLLALMYREPEQRIRSPKLMLRTLAVAAVPMLLILQQPDLGTVLTLVPPLVAVMFLGGVPIRQLAAVAATAIVLGAVLWLAGQPGVPVMEHLPSVVKPYQRDRVRAMFSDDLQVAGYQQQRALEAIGSGGVHGKGAGQIPVGLRVPEAHTDMILALVAEQYGLVGVGMLLLSYALLFGSGLAIAGEQRDPAGKMLTIGIVALLAGQTLLNLAVALRLMPVTGVTLPFVSYGGSSLVASFTAVGLIVNVSTHQKKLLL